MKPLCSLAFVCASSLLAQASPTAAPRTPAAGGDVSVDTTIRALYEGVSHPPGVEPDWTRLRSIFLPEARFTLPKRAEDPSYRVVNLDGFIALVSKGIATRKAQGTEKGFSEREIARKADCFGNLCQVFSTYESKYTPADPTPLQRGINSIQLVKDSGRWWVAAIAWDTERPDNPIPPQYLR